ncbi:MAG: cytochrome c biogenesis protein CcdA [Actinomycetota bacterium]|nr:cytochrome c biogenesis protein CcdA [Actinomycetota bacterium]
MAGETVTYIAAFGGGVVSFLSPCVLPLVPAYLSIITGLDVAEVRQGRARHLPGIAWHTGLFVAGFSAVFVLLGLSATTLGQAALRNQSTITRVSGLIMLAMALYVLGSLVLSAPGLYQERRFQPNLARFGPFAAPVAGVAFGFGWTPCFGPVMASVLSVAAASEGLGRAAALLLSYSAGLGLCFLVTGLALGRLAGVLRFVTRHSRGLTAVSAASLAVFGILLALDRLVWLTDQLKGGMEALGLGRLVTLGWWG